MGDIHSNVLPMKAPVHASPRAQVLGCSGAWCTNPACDQALPSVHSGRESKPHLDQLVHS